jgi:hypothetical protein
MAFFFWVFPLASPRQMLNILFVILICDISFGANLYSGDLLKKLEFAAHSRNLGKKWRTLCKILTLKKSHRCEKFDKNMLKLIKELKWWLRCVTRGVDVW